jgi:hypothetical protein
MLKKWILLGFLFAFMALQSQKQVIRIQEPTKQTVAYFYENRFDVAAYRTGKYIDVVVSEEEMDTLIQDGFAFTITQTEQQLKGNLRSSKDLEGYRTYDEVLLELLDYQAQYPDLCKLYNIGSSLGFEYSEEGNSNYDDYAHDIWALKVSDNVEIEEDEPNFYYMGAHHAREPISTEVVMTVLEHFMDNYGMDTEITENIQNSQIWFVPIVNPDGHKVVLTELDVWWRKNIRDNNENGVFNTDNYYGNGDDGVDLNRNYSWQWATSGASGDWNSPTYYGSTGFSEPETTSIKNLIDAHHFVAGISYHSYSELVLFPFGYADGVNAPDKLAMQNLAIEMAETIPADDTPSGHYIPQQAWELYPASGTTDDYAYGEYGIFSYTIELATEFIPPANVALEIADNNIEAAKILLNRITHSTLTGHIFDEETFLPVVAEINVHEIDNQGAYKKPYQSNETFGRYYRMLPEGIYDVTFSAFGYEPVTIENIAINDEGQTIVNVGLTTSASYSIEGTVQDGDTNEMIQNCQISLFYNEAEEPVLTMTTDNAGYFLFTEIPSGEYKIFFQHENYATYYENVIVNSNTILSISLYEPFIINFENNELSNFDFSGHAQWVNDSSTAFDGTYSARSGNIGSWQTSGISLEIETAHDGEISFFKKVSTEASYDFFYFYIDNELMGQWSGEMDWSESIFPLSTGEHTLEWIYEKDGYVDEGSDSVWLDNIHMPRQAGAVVFYPPRNLVGEVYYDTPNPYDNTMMITWEEPLQGSADLESYGIYRNYELIQTVNSNQLSFSEVNPPIYQNSEVHYYVVANYSNPEGTSEPSNIAVLGYQTESESAEVTFVTELKGNFPNPFNPSTTFYFSLRETDNVTVTIFNLKGQKIKSYKKENLPAGNHQIEWNGVDESGHKAASGIFFYQLKTTNYNSIKKMVMLK